MITTTAAPPKTAATVTTTTAIAERQQQRRKRRQTSHRKRSVAKQSIVATAMALALALSHQGPVHVEATANPSTSAALKALKSIDYRYFVAGGTCAAFSHGITTPIDVVKTKLQANPEKYKGKGLIGATVQICRDPDEGGPGALLSGLGPTVLGYGVEGAMKFGAYEVAKPIFGALLGDTRKVLSFILASFVAGAIASILLVPMESLRIKQVTDPSYQQLTVMSGLPKIIRDDGFWVTMSGIKAMLAKQVPYTFGKQVSFDLVAKFLYSVTASAKRIEGLLSDDQRKWIVSLLSAFCASIVACLCSQPGDMVLTETYNKGSSESTSKSKSKSKRNPKPSSSSSSPSSSSTPGSFRKVVGDIYGRGGVPEFFRGTQARLVHVGMIITSQLMVYDLVKQILGLPATGSH